MGVGSSKPIHLFVRRSLASKICAALSIDGKSTDAVENHPLGMLKKLAS